MYVYMYICINILFIYADTTYRLSSLGSLTSLHPPISSPGFPGWFQNVTERHGSRPVPLPLVIQPKEPGRPQERAGKSQTEWFTKFGGKSWKKSLRIPKNP